MAASRDTSLQFSEVVIRFTDQTFGYGKKKDSYLLSLYIYCNEWKYQAQR